MIEFLAANWLWIAAIVFLVAMHRSGHGCGMHGGHHHQGTDRSAHQNRTSTGAHRHGAS